MVDLNTWLPVFQQHLTDLFGNRIWFLGIQGSYARGEARESSDLDMVVILDSLSPEDIGAYRAMVQTLPEGEKLCGFLSGKEELLQWDGADLFQFYWDTKPILGSLDILKEKLDPGRAIHTGLCNLYHGCVHNMLYDRQEDLVAGLYKGAVFVLQALCYQQTGAYVSQTKALMMLLGEEDRPILEKALSYRQGAKVSFDQDSQLLLQWIQTHLKNKEGIPR